MEGLRHIVPGSPGAVGALLAFVGATLCSVVSAGPFPPEAWQPTATKNWWYLNGHLRDPGTEERIGSFMVTFDMEQGGDVAGHFLLFSFVDADPSKSAIGRSVPGIVLPRLDRYGATFLSAQATAAVERLPGASEWRLRAEPGPDLRLDLTFRSDYESRLRTGYPEGLGTGNILFWNQATIEGTLERGGSTVDVEGVGFLEHVWGSWSRIPQKGVDYLNLHLKPDGDGGLPVWGSVYFRRTFYHGAPGRGPYAADVGPVLFFSRDGTTWQDATGSEIHCSVLTSSAGEPVPCAEHRTGHPATVRLETTFDDGSVLALEVTRLAEATIEVGGGAGEVHEGAVTVSGSFTPVDGPPVPLEGTGESEYQRFGPFYPY